MIQDSGEFFMFKLINSLPGFVNSPTMMTYPLYDPTNILINSYHFFDIEVKSERIYTDLRRGKYSATLHQD